MPDRVRAVGIDGVVGSTVDEDVANDGGPGRCFCRIADGMVPALVTGIDFGRDGDDPGRYEAWPPR